MQSLPIISVILLSTVLSACNVNDTAVKETVVKDTIVKDNLEPETIAPLPLFNGKSLSLNIDDVETLYAKGTGISISYFINDTFVAMNTTAPLGFYNGVPGKNYLRLEFNSWPKDKNAEVKIEFFDSPKGDLEKGKLLYVLTQDDFPNRPDQEVIEIILNTKGYFPELDPLLVKYESRTRILWKDLPKADVEKIMSQKMTSMKNKLKEFDNQPDAEAFLNTVINQVNSYIGSPIKTISIGSRN